MADPSPGAVDSRLQEALAGMGVARQVVRAVPLGGGVSSDVYDVVTTTDRLVVKFALAQLKVEEPWFAPLSRATVERKAILIAADRAPVHVPELVGWNEDDGVLAMRHLGDLVSWKHELLAGAGDAHVGSVLGSLLAGWQDIETTELCGLGPESADNFLELRTRPFYLAVAQRRPDLSTDIETLIDEAAGVRDCLVHGDFSPKNIMVGREVVVLDWEVAHVGDPAYDPAFLTCHLILKALARPSVGVEAAADGFLARLDELRPEHPWRRTWQHTGALMLARLVGTSRVDYLTADQQIESERIGRRLLNRPPAGSVPIAHVLDSTDIF